MKVLYYTWNENTFETCYNAMLEKGWKVECVNYPFKSYDYDEQFMDNLREQLRDYEIKSVNQIFYDNDTAEG